MTDAYDISTTRAAEFLRVHPHTVQRWADSGDLPSWRTPGGWRRFRQSDLIAFLATNTPDDEPEEAAAL